MNRTTQMLLYLFSSSLCLQPVFAQVPEFPVWLEELRAEAIASGISEDTVNAALADVAPIERVTELDRNQPEFRLDFWGYVNRVVSDVRISQGREQLALASRTCWRKCRSATAFPKRSSSRPGP